MGQDFLQARREHIQNIVKSVSEEEFKDYVGFEAYQFMEARSQLISGNILKPAFTLPGLLLGPVWAGYRKMWAQVGLCVLAVAILGVFGLALNFIILGLYGSKRYVSFASQRIQRLKAIEPDSQRVRTISTIKGGVSILQAVAALLIVIFFTGLQVGFVSGIPTLIKNAEQKVALQKVSNDPNYVAIAGIATDLILQEYAKANDIPSNEMYRIQAEKLLWETFTQDGEEYTIGISATIADKESACNACQPTIGFFSWKKSGEGYIKTAEEFKLGQWSLGGFGSSPEVKWYGGEKAEFAIITSHMAQGEVGSGETRFRIENGRPIQEY